MIDDDILCTYVWSLFKEGEISLDTLLDCLMELRDEFMLTIYDPEPLWLCPDGRPCFTIYSVFRDIWSTEHIKGSCNDDQEMGNDAHDDKSQGSGDVKSMSDCCSPSSLE